LKEVDTLIYDGSKRAFIYFDKSFKEVDTIN